ncbi:hypothetical protein CALVIDRAFT_538087 [Calocera viscosa TUFC12733]|uniref:Uncharacterized protein n=1 Tax=Calocera viscosa (strain TUFC12733) TaxID=1330018 RepID=A0A167L3S2_CALVF|nr:hypothetical protein CALVIDRAFT_538087 [Calocera viscosa TUFC12733]
MIPLAIPAPCIPQPAFLSLATIGMLDRPQSAPSIPQPDPDRHMPSAPAFLRTAVFLSLSTIGMHDGPRPFLRDAPFGLVTIAMCNQPWAFLCAAFRSLVTINM